MPIGIITQARTMIVTNLLEFLINVFTELAEFSDKTICH